MTQRKLTIIAFASIASFFLAIFVGGLLVHLGLMNMYLNPCPVGDAIACWMAISAFAFLAVVTYGIFKEEK
jgi:hypothetical protein